MAANNIPDIDLKLINNPELLKLFNELNDKLKNQIVLGGMRKAANLIVKEIKTNFQSVKKNKSKTNYKNFNKLFKIESIKDEKNGFGLKLGITKEGYKYKWLQWGTEQRSYKKNSKKSVKNLFKKSVKNEHLTGAITATNFFYSAVERSMDKANNMISSAVMQNFDRIIRKYNNTK